MALKDALGSLAGTVSNIGSSGKSGESSTSAVDLFQSGKKLAQKIADAVSDKKGYSGDPSTQGSDSEGYKKGGVVKKTGLAKVHKGERVLTKAQAKKYTASKKGKK